MLVDRLRGSTLGLALGISMVAAMCSVPASAATIVTEDRFVFARSCDPPPASPSNCPQPIVYVTDGPPLFDESVSATNSLGETATAFQTITVTDGGVVGSGGATTALSTTDDLWGVASASTVVIFDVSAPTAFTFSASSSVTSLNDSRVLMRLGQPGVTDVIYRYRSGSAASGPDQLSGVLTPGQWTFEVLTSGHGVSELSWNVDFQLVPEPASLLLLGAGLVALGGARRR